MSYGDRYPGSSNIARPTSRRKGPSPRLVGRPTWPDSVTIKPRSRNNPNQPAEPNRARLYERTS